MLCGSMLSRISASSLISLSRLSSCGDASCALVVSVCTVAFIARRSCVERRLAKEFDQLFKFRDQGTTSGSAAGVTILFPHTESRAWRLRSQGTQSQPCLSWPSSTSTVRLRSRLMAMPASNKTSAG